MTKRDRIPAPKVNLNGTSAKALTAQVVAVREALEALDKALAEASPHGRDYQLQPEVDLAEARGFHAANRAYVSEMADAYGVLHIRLIDQE